MVISRVVCCVALTLFFGCYAIADQNDNDTALEKSLLDDKKEIITDETGTNVPVSSVLDVFIPTEMTLVADKTNEASQEDGALIDKSVGNNDGLVENDVLQKNSNNTSVSLASLEKKQADHSGVLEGNHLEPITVAPVITVPVDEQQQDVELVGIDTVDLKDPQGNWLFKRIWWERAEAKYEKIRARVAAIFEARMLFFAKRSEFDKKVIDPFFISIGISGGQLQELMNAMIERIEKERAAEGSLNEQERELLANLQHDYDLVEQIKRDVLQVEAISRGVDDALDKLIEQINRVRNYEQEAWQLFKEVARVLNDKKAREIFYQMDAISKNISNVATYVQQQFEPHFNNLVATGQKQVERLNLMVKELQEKGVNFKERYEQLEKLHHEPLKSSSRENQEEEPEQEYGVVRTYFINPVLNVINYMVSGVVFSYRWVVSFFIDNKIEEPA